MWASCFFTSCRILSIFLFGLHFFVFTRPDWLTFPLVLVVGLAKVWLVANNVSNRKLPRKANEKQVIVRIWTVYQLTVAIMSRKQEIVPLQWHLRFYGTRCLRHAVDVSPLRDAFSCSRSLYSVDSWAVDYDKATLQTNGLNMALFLAFFTVLHRTERTKSRFKKLQWLYL